MRKIIFFLLVMLSGMPNVALASAGFGDHDEREDVHDLWSTPEYNKIVFFWNNSGLCTAQYVWYNIVLTARHCITSTKEHDNYVKVGQVVGKIRSSSLEKSEVVAEAYGYDRKDDWALLRITDPKLYSDNYFNLNPKTRTQTLQTAGFGWCRVMDDSEIDTIKSLFLSHPYYARASFAELWDGVYEGDKIVYPGIKDLAIKRGIRDLDDFDESTKTTRLKTHKNCNVFADHRNVYYADSDCDITQGNSGGTSFYGNNINGLVSSVISSWKDSEYASFMLRTERFTKALDMLRRKYPKATSGTPEATPDTLDTDDNTPIATPKRKATIVLDPVLERGPFVMTVGESRSFDLLFQGESISADISDTNIASVEIKNVGIIVADLYVVAKNAGTATISLTTKEDDRYKKTTKDLTITVNPKESDVNPGAVTPKSDGSDDKPDSVPDAPTDTGPETVVPKSGEASETENQSEDQNKNYAIIQVRGLDSHQVIKVGGFKIAEVLLNTGGHLSVSLSNENVARVVFTGKDLRVIAKSPGETILTLTAEENDLYRETSKEFVITVTDGSQQQHASFDRGGSGDLFDGDIRAADLQTLQQQMDNLDSDLTGKLQDIPNMTRKNMVAFLGQAVYYDHLRNKYEQARARELSPANKILSALSIGATGVGGMMAASAISEQRADEKAERDMNAYMNTMRCYYGNGRSARVGETNVELPGGNALINLYTEYATLANDLKVRKTALGLAPGIESYTVVNTSNAGLYDDNSTGVTGGVYASIYRALTNPDGEDAKKWKVQRDKTTNKLKVGATVAGVGAVGGLVGNVIINGWDGQSGLLKLDESTSDEENSNKMLD